MDHNKIIKKIKSKGRFLSVLLMVMLFTVVTIIYPLGTPTVAYGVSTEWNGSAAASFAGGTGIETDPYLISTGEQLAYFSQQVSAGNTYEGKYIILTQDILLNRMNTDGTFVSGSPRQFTAIGFLNNQNVKPFKGYFDGAGYEIIGLYIEKNWLSHQGLFSYADIGSVIKKVKISGSVVGGDNSGSVAGYTNGLITECTTNCSVTAEGKSYHGGIAGYAGISSIISDCTASGTIGGSEGVGGIVGYTEGKVTGCSSDCVVKGVKKIGGIVGYAAGTGSEIINSIFSGTAKGNSDCIGGIAGQSEGLIGGCTVNATLEGSNGTIGGIVGYAAGEGSIISDCTVSGTVKATGGYGYIGGAAGKADGKITGCAAECSVEAAGQHYVGGIVGSAGTDSEVSYSSSSGVVSGIGKVGGIAGYTDGEIKICINTGNVNGSNGYTGGVAGETGNSSTVSNSYNSGIIYGGGQGNIGGIVGHAGTGTIVHHNLNKGTVDGNSPVGSVIGNSVHPDNVWNNYYYDYENAPGGTNNNNDITEDDGAVPIGDLTWEEVQDLLNENNKDDDGNDIWNQDMDDEGIPKPGEGEGSTSSPVLNIDNTLLKEGKHYSATQLGTSISATITSDSVFTVLFCLEYKASSAPEGQTLKLKNVDNNTAAQFPAGTSVIMRAEASEDSPGNPYYYINLTEEANTLTLGSFIKMGSQDDSYSPTPVAGGDEKQYLFIFDFSKTATENQIPAGSYSIELSYPGGGYSGTAPVITIAGKNDYSLTVTIDSAEMAANSFTIGLAFGKTSTPVSGYDYKTGGKIFASEFYLEKEGTGGRGVREPLPIGTKIIKHPEGITKFISSTCPYVFLPLGSFELGQTTMTFTLDFSECVVPPNPGGYTLKVTACAFTGPDAGSLNPRGGYYLAEGQADITLLEPVIYAIKAEAQERSFGRSVEPIPVPFKIQTLGSNTIKATLQRKYGKTYKNLDGEINRLINVTQEGVANLSLPEKSPRGTYRFVFVLYGEDGTAKAETVKNIIIK